MLRLHVLLSLSLVHTQAPRCEDDYASCANSMESSCRSLRDIDFAFSHGPPPHIHPMTLSIHMLYEHGTPKKWPPSLSGRNSSHYYRKLRSLQEDCLPGTHLISCALNVRTPITETVVDGTICSPIQCDVADVAHWIRKAISHNGVIADDGKCEVLGKWEDLKMDWLIVGFHKMGTSTVAQALGKHPNLTLVADIGLDELAFLIDTRALPSQDSVDFFNRYNQTYGECKECLPRSRGAKITIGLEFCSAAQKLYTLPLLEHPLWKSRYHRFMWTDILPQAMHAGSAERAPRIVIVVRDPVQCFYTGYHWLVMQEKSRTDPREYSGPKSLPPSAQLCAKQGFSFLQIHRDTLPARSVRTDIQIRGSLETLAFDDNESIFLCTLLHNRCAASFQLYEACMISPSLCTEDRLKIVQVETFTEEKLEKLAHWVSHGTDEHHVTGNKSRPIGKMNIGKYRENSADSADDNGRPPSVSKEAHERLVKSYLDEYEQMPTWIARFGRL